VVSTFVVDPPAAPPTVSPSGRRVLVGDGSRLRVRFAAPGGPAEMVGIVARGQDRGRLLAARTTGGRAYGSVSLPTSRLPAGHYNVVLRDAGTGETLARSPVWVYERGTPTRLTTDARTYRAGRPVTVTWDGAPGEHLDWIGLYRCRRRCDQPGDYLAYRYTRTRIQGSLVLSDVVLPGEAAPPWPLPPGQYVARLLVDDSYRVAGQSGRFRVVPR
jgi:hypothetical protein